MNFRNFELLNFWIFEIFEFLKFLKFFFFKKLDFVWKRFKKIYLAKKLKNQNTEKITIPFSISQSKNSRVKKSSHENFEHISIICHTMYFWCLPRRCWKEVMKSKNLLLTYFFIVARIDFKGNEKFPFQPTNSIQLFAPQYRESLSDGV